MKHLQRSVFILLIFHGTVSAQHVLRSEANLPRPASVRIQLRTTMGLIVKEENKGVVQAGAICRSLLDVYTLPVNDYILDIRLDDYLINRVILKR